MHMKTETIAGIRSKLQTTCLIIERIEAGEDVPESFIDLGIKNLKEAGKLLGTLKESRL